VVLALTIGPLVQLFLARWTVPERDVALVDPDVAR
jgi:hypothetical protein